MQGKCFRHQVRRQPVDCRRMIRYLHLHRALMPGLQVAGFGQLKIGASAEPAVFEWLPCSLKTTGPCKKDEYFIVREDDSTTPSTPVVHMRGRKLLGLQTQLPEGYTLLHLQRGKTSLVGENLQAEWEAVSTSRDCRVWEHDIAPCESTGRIRAMEWLQLAPSMHAPILVDEVEARLAQAAGSSAVSPAEAQDKGVP